MTAESILKQLIEDVSNSDIANAEAAIIAARKAKELFDEVGSPAEKVPRARQKRKDETGDPGQAGKVDGRTKAARAARAKGIIRKTGSGVSAEASEKVSTVG